MTGRHTDGAFEASKRAVLKSVSIWQGDRCIAEVEVHDCDEATALEIAQKMAAAPELLEALAPFAELKLPARCEGNAAFYSILHKQILAARAAIAKASPEVQP